jgi:hypothetical protein
MRPLTLLAAALTVLAFAPTAFAATPYDGTYIGTSASMLGALNGSGRGCATFQAPGPLTITNGHAQTKWGDGKLEGDVSADGALVMRSSLSGTFQGKIDAQGVLTGGYMGGCQYSLKWQRR